MKSVLENEFNRFCFELTLWLPRQGQGQWKQYKMVKTNCAYKHGRYEKNWLKNLCQMSNVKVFVMQDSRLASQMNTAHYTDPYDSQLDKKKQEWSNNCIKQTALSRQFDAWGKIYWGYGAEEFWVDRGQWRLYHKFWAATATFFFLDIPSSWQPMMPLFFSLQILFFSCIPLQSFMVVCIFPTYILTSSNQNDQK